MPRYAVGASKFKSWDIDEDKPFRPHLTVDDHEAIDTGLIWSTGESIMRLTNPMGFGRDDEW